MTAGVMRSVNVEYGLDALKSILIYILAGLNCWISTGCAVAILHRHRQKEKEPFGIGGFGIGGWLWLMNHKYSSVFLFESFQILLPLSLL